MRTTEGGGATRRSRPLSISGVAMNREALLAAVLQEPEDDALRLVLADWHEEHGESERAELIRVGVEVARADPAADRFALLQTRERQLLAAHAKDWFTDLDVAHR